jgi:hypothetical protein
MTALLPLLLALPAAAPQAASAPPSSRWTWAEAGLGYNDIENGDDGFGPYARASVSIPGQDVLFLFGGAGVNTGFVAAPFAGESTGYEAGAGLRFALSPTLEAFGGGSWLSADSHNGWGVRAGLKFRPEPRVDADATVLVQSIGRTEAGLELGLRAWVQPWLALGGGVLLFEHDQALGMTLRFAL